MAEESRDERTGVPAARTAGSGGPTDGEGSVSPAEGAGPSGAAAPAPGPFAGGVVSPSGRALFRLLRLRPARGPRPTGQRVADPLFLARAGIVLGILLTLLLFLALLVVFFLPGAAFGSVSDGVNFDKPTKDWYQGPVRYIITKQEVKAYKALDNELDRASFIDWFWQRRDTEPGTPQNEFRERFEQRVFEATRMFDDTVKPGWKTDMGKVYILVGPPDEMNKDVMAKTHRGIVTWVYRKPPFPDLNPNTVIGFAKGPDGEFHLSTNPTLDSDVARGLQFSRTPRTADDRPLVAGLSDPALLDAGAPLAQNPLQIAMTYGRMQQLPPDEEKLFHSLVTTQEFYGAIPADSCFGFYRATDGTTYTTVTIGIKSSSVQYRSEGKKEVPDVAVFGKLINKDHPDQVYSLASDASFSPSEGNAVAGPSDSLIFQATGGFKAGRYQLVLGVQDRVSKRIASYRKDVDVPDLGGDTLRLSSIALAGTMDPTDYVSQGGKPFHLGKFLLIPQPDSTFRRKDELNVYFQIYNPGTDAEAGRPKLDIYYDFQARQVDGTYKDMGAYQVKASGAQVQGYAVPLAKWPEGTYRVQVVVKDLVASKTATSVAEFLIKD
jgi:GWxTD domain-containing protein